MSLSIPQYLMKRMFPAGQSMFLVRKDGASEPNYLMIQAINIAMPLEIPVPGMEGFNVNDVANYGKISIDGNPLNITPERFQNDVSMWYQGLCMDYDFLDRMIHGETDPFIIPIGGKVTVLLRLQDDIDFIRTIGPHTFGIRVDYQGFIINVDIPLDLTEENTNLEFDPSLT